MNPITEETMLRALRLFILLLAPALFLSGCSGTIAQFTMVSNREIDDAALRGGLPGGKKVEGESSRLTQLIIFPTFMSPTIGEAVDDALDQGGGDLLIHAAVEREIVWIPYLISVETIRVKGSVINTGAESLR
jgi:hypothetical protein